jgi:hypothetical protein
MVRSAVFNSSPWIFLNFYNSLSVRRATCPYSNDFSSANGLRRKNGWVGKFPRVVIRLEEVK